MKRKYVVRKKLDFERILKLRDQKSSKYFAVYKEQSKDDFSRFGISAPKKIYRSAVTRNKVKRIIREIITNNQNFENNCNYIVIARKGVLTTPFKDLTNEFVKLFSKIKG